MKQSIIIQRMQHNLSAIEALVSDVPDVQAHWRPSPDDWSIVEVMHHLADEEREDFRTRLILTLAYPGQAWPPIDPAGWVTRRRYQERELAAGLSRFRAARQASIHWLQTLDNPTWDRSFQHPAGEISAGDLLASWLAHDHLHIRQLNELHYRYFATVSAPYSPGYAGDW